jgi:ssRNA-specific RNase YbeY (16S rRNA maturation enzyme)
MSPRAVHGFLGLVGYYHHFIKDFSTIAAPLTALLQKEGFKWTEDAMCAFRALQHSLTSALVL